MAGGRFCPKMPRAEEWAGSTERLDLRAGVAAGRGSPQHVMLHAVPLSAFVAVRLGAACSECMGAVPIKRLEPRAHCHHCLSTVEVPWREDLFGLSWMRAPRSWPVGEHDHSSNVALKVRLEAKRVAAAPDGAPSREADVFVKWLFPDATAIFGETESIDPRPEPVSALVTACLSCGAGLKVDGSDRVVECDHCSASNFLSDALWLRLHPVVRLGWLVIGYA